MEQYKDFAAIYDELIYGDVDYEAWAKKILELCHEADIETRHYLDLACGTGNMTEKLAKEFRNVWAVDLSGHMLTEAESKLRAQGIKAKFACQDICRLKLNQTFDLITCCLDSVNYIQKNKDIESFFNCAHSHLKEDGLFIFDINSYYKLTEVLGNNLYNYDSDDVVYVWENSLENDIVHMNLTFFVKEGSLYRRFDEEHTERAYTEDFLDKLLENTGFTIFKKLNEYSDASIDGETERITYVVKKKQEEK
jgi:SAM-dependent methyltransferase